MKKELFLKLLQINDESDNLLKELYGMFAPEYLETKGFYTTDKMLKEILLSEYGEEGCNVVIEYLYRDNGFKYSKEEPWDNINNIYNTDTLFQYIETLKK